MGCGAQRIHCELRYLGRGRDCVPDAVGTRHRCLPCWKRHQWHHKGRRTGLPFSSQKQPFPALAAARYCCPVFPRRPPRRVQRWAGLPAPLPRRGPPPPPNRCKTCGAPLAYCLKILFIAAYTLQPLLLLPSFLFPSFFFSYPLSVLLYNNG